MELRATRSQCSEDKIVLKLCGPNSQQQHAAVVSYQILRIQYFSENLQGHVSQQPMVHKIHLYVLPYIFLTCQWFWTLPEVKYILFLNLNFNTESELYEDNDEVLWDKKQSTGYLCSKIVHNWVFEWKTHSASKFICTSLTKLLKNHFFYIGLWELSCMFFNYK